jgi:hypothetical protein
VNDASGKTTVRRTMDKGLTVLQPIALKTKNI